MAARPWPRALPPHMTDGDGGFSFGPQTTSSTSSLAYSGQASSTQSADDALTSTYNNEEDATSTSSLADIPPVTVNPITVGETSAFPTSGPVSQNQHAHDDTTRLSSGSLAAAIVVPIIALLLLALGAFFFLRQRRREQNATNRAGSGGSRSSFLPLGLKEKWGGKGSHAPELMNTTNNAYYTGLDSSSSDASRSQDVRRSEGDPPPPYVRKPVPAAVVPEVPQVPMDFAPAAMLDTPATVARSSSARSFTSTLYSDTASVHSARAARRSMGPHVVQPATSGAQLGSRRPSREGDEEGPFGDEANSPVSPLSDSDSV